MRVLRLIPVLLLVACATSKDPSGVGPGSGTSDDGSGALEEAPDASTAPSPYAPDLPGTEAVAFDREAVEAAMVRIVGSLDGLDSTPVFDAYDAAMANGESRCPAFYELDGNVFWYASCTTSEGVWFDGYAFDAHLSEYTVDADGNIWDTEYISGAATVREPSGETFHAGGFVQRSWTEDANGFILVQESILGSFLDDTAPADTWLGRGEMPSLSSFSGVDGEGGFAVGGYRGWAGALGGLGSDGRTAMSTELLMVATTSLGIPCQDEPNGTLSVRTPDGGWWDVTYDIDPETWRLTGDCDGCGTVRDAAGDVVGEACADFSSLLD